ncbi:MAG: HAMP domain-containing histidine kinase [Myxococcales bacterium]|nr:HAMP domain-containing histidine kinase [Myxococcales bacterium]
MNGAWTFEGVAALRERDIEEAGMHERTERSCGRGWRGREEAASIDSLDEALLDEDERIARDARQLADRKVALYRDLVRASLISLPLLIFIPFAGAIALVWFGVKLGRRAFRLYYEPGLRERFVQEEVARRVRSRVSDERRSLEGEHLRSLEQLSASIAHEIRNPITAAKSLVQQMGEDPVHPDRSEYARLALAELERVERSVSHLLRFGREEDRRVAPLVMEDVLESALETFRERIARVGIDVRREYDSEGCLEGDAEQLRRVAINLLGNAIDALEEARTQDATIRVGLGESLAGDAVWIRIEDNGPGVDVAASDRIFEPFVSTRTGGTGLGLALCRKIVEEHGGGIELDRARQAGTAILVTLPRMRATAGAGGSAGRGEPR